MKTTVLILTILILASNLRAQSGIGNAGNVVLGHGVGAPSGICTSTQQYINDSNGNFYTCWLGTWTLVGTAGGAVPAGASTQVQFNDSGSFGASANFTFDKTSGAGLILGANTLLTDGSGGTFGFSGGDFTAASGGVGSSAAISANGGGALLTDSTNNNVVQTAADGSVVITATNSNATTLTGPVNVASLTASRCIATDGSKNLVSSGADCNAAPAFSAITSGTNTVAAMVLGTGGSLTVSGSGTNNSTTLNGATFAAPGTIGGGTPGVATFTGLTAATYSTATNCADSAGAAACGSAAAGAFVVDAAATSTVVSTTAITANSEVFIQYDSSLGTRLGVTCNTTVALPAVTARTAATSFTITVPVAPAVNPACYDYHIVN